MQCNRFLPSIDHPDCKSQSLLSSSPAMSVEFNGDSVVAKYRTVVAIQLPDRQFGFPPGTVVSEEAVNGSL